MTAHAPDRPLLEALPSLARQVRFAPLADLPTPVRTLSSLAGALGRPPEQLWEKRDDLTSAAYGGNKVRTLEVLLGRALERGHRRVYATGAYGSNHAMATAIHAPRLGLEPGALLYPQPAFSAAKENLRWMLSLRPRLHFQPLAHWSSLPAGMLATALEMRWRGIGTTIMEPGGAVPWGALGYVSAGLELAKQVAAGLLPCPSEVVCPVGSNCTAAGLLVGFELATQLKLGFAKRAAWGGYGPQIRAVRVTPWPVTTRFRILQLARASAALLQRLSGERSMQSLDTRLLGARLLLDTTQLGRGYGFPSGPGQTAVAMWNRHPQHPLETTYSGKAAAAFVQRASHTDAPLLFWSTKSSAAPPAAVRASESDSDWAPRPVQRWLSG